jgi:hypothetical protein
MPKYFFHVLDGLVAIDNDGLTLANDDQARTEALRGAGEMLNDRGLKIWLGNEWMMAVADEEGSVLFKLKFTVEYPNRPTLLLN